MPLTPANPSATYRLRGTGEVVDTEVEVPFRLAPDCDVLILDRVAHG